MAELYEGGTGRDATEIVAGDHKEFMALVGSIEGKRTRTPVASSRTP